MTTAALICLDGYRVDSVLDAAAATLNPALAWVLFFVSDTRPTEEVEHALQRLPGRDSGRHRAEARIRHVVKWSEEDVRAAVTAWLNAADYPAELVVRRGRPEQEILRLAEERSVSLIALGGGRGLPGRYPGPGPAPLSPVARYVVDHALCDVLLLRRYVAEQDRRA
ncbi:MAG: universal stress protein [Thermomicrobiales bacterium]